MLATLGGAAMAQQAPLDPLPEPPATPGPSDEPSTTGQDAATEGDGTPDPQPQPEPQDDAAQEGEPARTR